MTRVSRLHSFQFASNFEIYFFTTDLKKGIKMAFTAFEDVQIDYKYVVYCAWGRNVLCFADDDADETLGTLPLLNVDFTAEFGSVPEKGHTIDIWTKPLTQRVYADCLVEYAYCLCGKNGTLGDEARMEADGWKKHVIKYNKRD